MICTDDKELSRALVMARAHGWDRNLDPKEAEKLRRKFKIDDFYARYTFYDLAYNARPNEITGFLGNKQIKYFDEIVSKRQKNFDAFQNAINQNDDFVHYDFSHMSVVSNFAMPVICKDKKTADRYKKKFMEADVEIRPVIAGNITRQPFYQKYSKLKHKCPTSDLIHANGFYFGNNAEMDRRDIDKLVGLLKEG